MNGKADTDSIIRTLDGLKSNLASTIGRAQAMHDEIDWLVDRLTDENTELDQGSIEVIKDAVRRYRTLTLF